MSSDRYAPCIEAHERRLVAAARARGVRVAAAREAAVRAAGRLRQLGARSVILFGSVLRADWFEDHSDIDLAIEGVDPEVLRGRSLQAIEDEARPFRLDVRALEQLPAYVRNAIVDTGEPI